MLLFSHFYYFYVFHSLILYAGDHWLIFNNVIFWVYVATSIASLSKIKIISAIILKNVFLLIVFVSYLVILRDTSLVRLHVFELILWGAEINLAVQTI